MDAKYVNFEKELLNTIKSDCIFTDTASTLAYGTDAGFYRLIPKIVVRANSESEIIEIIRLANKYKVALCFRAAGTSLSGQSVTDSVLVLLGDKWKDANVYDNGETIVLKPGIIGAIANKHLKQFGRKIGPDPASIATAKIGGMIANNSSGMCCGTKNNAYHTLKSMRIVFADGTILDTSKKDSVEAFRKSHSKLLSQIEELSNTIKSNPELESRIRHKYRLKNTTGYGINSLIDFDDPIEKIAHLMVGSEGTLGFISEVSLRTVEDYPNRASALILFGNLDDCCNAVSALRESDLCDAVEMIDSRGMKAVKGSKNLPDFIYGEMGEKYASLLIEVRAESAPLLTDKIAKVEEITNRFSPKDTSGFSSVPEVYSNYWKVRGGLFPAVGAVRAVGTTVIIEDVAFPIERLAEGVSDLTSLLKKYNYNEAIIFGHALEGNLHFVFTQNFEIKSEIERYDSFMQEVNELVVKKYNGSLKAEHGTGRNVAPFVKMEWGGDAYDVMCKIKQIFDPENLLNPDVIISSNSNLHLENLKSMPAADPLVDTCIECGYCEPVCPSAELTLSPRQRIVLWRRIQQLTAKNEKTEELKHLKERYNYLGIETCANDGMCATRCPVGINTGVLMKKLNQQPKTSGAMSKIADNFGTAVSFLKFGLKALNVSGKIVGKNNIHKATKYLNEKANLPFVPMNGMPHAADKLPQPKAQSGTEVVYFVSCVNRAMAEGTKDNRTLAESTIKLLEGANFKVIYPKNIPDLCCGQPFSSQNKTDIANKMLSELNESLLETSLGGKLPIFLDNSSCAQKVFEARDLGLLDKRLNIYDSISFLTEFVVNQVSFEKKHDKLFIHIPCSATKLGADEKLKKLAFLCTKELVVSEVACCGFAGAKGFLTPEVNENSLRNLKSEIPSGCNTAVSSSRLCQIGLTHHSGLEYHSIERLLDECMIKS